LLCLPASQLEARTAAKDSDLFELNLEELSQIEVTAGSLIPVENRYSPSQVLLINRRMIEYSGARNLNELLYAFIPGFQYLRHPALPDRVGMRGMISDTNDKMLLLVNGKNMNSQPLMGIDSEYDLSMLGDIEKIEVVNGPGSATYGSGALNGVVSITTRNASTYKGLGVSVRAGSGEEFYNTELQWGGNIPSGGKLYLYCGFDKYSGARNSETPVYYGNTFQIRGSGTTVIPGKPVELPFLNDHASDLNIRSKAFADYRIGNFNAWARYTEGGTSGLRTGRALLMTRGFIMSPENYKSPYRQFTVVLNQSFFPRTALKIDAQLSYDQMYASWFLRIPSNYESDEKKYSAKITARWKPSEKHSFAAGAEYMHGDYRGLYDAGFGAVNFNWNTDYYALMAEYFWNFLPKWQTVLSARMDKRTESNYVLSPRAALIYEPGPASTLALSWSLSNRLGDEFYNQYYRKIGVINTPGTEKIDTLELRYNRMLGSSWMFQALIHSTEQDIMAWDHTRMAEQMQGRACYNGAELSIYCRNDRSDFVLSHAYNKLQSMRLNGEYVRTLISAQPYGYGNDFHMVPDNITKINFNYRFDKRLSSSFSLQKIWQYEGADPFSLYNRDVLRNPAYTLTDASAGIRFEGPTLVNAGLIYALEKNWKASLFAHNILGWFNRNLNGAHYYSCMDSYRIEAAAVSLQLSTDF
jgi:iron complex outermembrane receptor protein